ncbi:uncharacterized protein N7496_005937 [Penicillium cataractarum]|uniref:Uncharacterized protein n=1 Tax=Penicillium cataractarum TaxID=2100454 RepID=A0A9W9S0U7_9EURO|nr:uncharacterized protein N7496_005937 [Penicillium cataractarum]KAJ5369845.1 hypothetical protein N7496_005937 [Penicillium cataractarum]
MFGQPWAWKPLQDILQAYLEMIEEKKVQASTDEAYEEDIKPRLFPWRYHQYTHRDVVKATQALTRLLDAVEQKLPQPRETEYPASTRDVDIQLPYSQAILDEATIPANTFIRDFLSELPPRTLRFRYIAPGIILQSPAEFATQPWKEPLGREYGGHSVPFLLFRGDQWISLRCKPRYYPDPEDSLQGVPTGLYICPTGIESPATFGNSCRLLLPFNIGARHHARYSNGEQLQEETPWDETPKDTAHELYQPGSHSGFLERHEVQIHKILLNWAERVEAGDWEVNTDGVAGGIEKFEEADTLESWRKYQIPLAW